MEKISVIGAGNVGGMCAMRIAENKLGEVVLVDIAHNLASAKVFDMEDARYALKSDYVMFAGSDFSAISGSSIIVVTAGFARRPGMTREELLNKNGQIITEIAIKVKQFSREAICIIVTNPVDIMTQLFLEKSGLTRQRVFGMGLGLDASRFANLISKRLNVSLAKIKTTVLGAHGEGMLPVPRLSSVDGKPLTTVASEEVIEELKNQTVKRGAEIVNLYGSGSAYFAPSAAILEIIKALIQESEDAVGVSAYLEGEYGISDACIGIPVKLGKKGIIEIIKLGLNNEELSALKKSAEAIKASVKSINL